MDVQPFETTGPYNERGLLPFDAGKDSCGVSFIADIKNRQSHKIVQQGLTALERLTHRGATGCEENTGDGAGVLTQLPDKFLRKVAQAAGLATLPAVGAYGVGMAFLPKDAKEQASIKSTWEKLVKEEGQVFLGWRSVPVNNSMIGPTALKAEPAMAMVFIGRAAGLDDQDAFERKLYLIRKRSEGEVLASSLQSKGAYYVASLSSRTIVYKGMLTPEQVRPYFPDLADPDFESAICISHSRFSTNTFPSWDLAHPFRYLAHNGEINTLRGNANWMHARQALFQSKYFPGQDIKRLLPIISEGGSDSAALDNALELLTLTGRSLAHAMMMLIPEAWTGHKSMSQAKKDFYRYHASLMEPWDGPADVVFSDGRSIGGVLDRNGLRPSRISITNDGTVILASETGVLGDLVDPATVVQKTRLEPGRMFLVDLEKGLVVNDEELKENMAKAQPYGDWLAKKLLTLKDLPEAGHVPGPDHDTLLHRQVAFGYTHEDLKMVMAPMALDGMEAIGSMGDDIPLAVLSDKPQLLFSYFKQLFAQVTNPPLDAIREELVTSVVTTIGPEGDLLNPGPENCRQIELQSPVLTNDDLARFKLAEKVGFKAVTLPMVYNVTGGGTALAKALDDLFKSASQAVDKGAQILILSDRGIDAGTAPIPSLLATAGLHHHLIREGKRTQVGLIVESGEPREVHHFALLIGYGANAINPYVAFETVEDLSRRNLLPETVTLEKAQYHFIKASNKGIVKVMSKMGISTIQSYRGAQIFEAIGLAQPLIDRYFTWTASRLQGIGLDEIAQETALRHELAFSGRTSEHLDLDWGGKYKWRREGEQHLMDATSVGQLQHAAYSGDYKAFKHFSHRINSQSHRLLTLRGLLRFKAGRQSIPISEVEPVSEIVKRFTTGAMSYGSISQEAHETLAIAMNRLGGKSNTGEGGEDEERFTKMPNGDSKRSAIKQVASGRFGVTSHYLVNAQQIQIKMAQGAKPGEGGQLPAKKVWPWIAKTRHSTPFVGLISPPPHHDIYSIEDLAQLIHDLKNANKEAAISVKLVSEVGVGTVAAGVAKAKADHILISGHDGGTGASPLTSLKYAGVPWELGLSEAHQILVLNGLRDRVKIETDGQLRTGKDVVTAALMGAEEFGFATVALVTTGCIMMRVCHLDTCPAGVATQNPDLRAKFIGKPEYVVNFMTFVAEETREIMAELGFRTVAEMVGHSEVLEANPDIKHWKASKLDLGPLIRRVEEPYAGSLFKTKQQDHGLAKALDNRIIADAKEAIDKGKAIHLNYKIENLNRSVGTMLGSEISRKHGSKGLPENTIQLDFTGSAGQSFGAFVPKGVTLRLEGDSNDYVGKGLCGGRIVVVPSPKAPFKAEGNIIVGNTLFYGATAGEGFIRGRAGERFCVRNSGVNAVVEGLGDHGCEYMTGGRIVVLGPTGRNFGAGMSGGIAYVLDEGGDFGARCNMELVELEDLAPDDEELVKELLRKHQLYTGSTVAEKVLENWRETRRRIVKVIPSEYKKALQAQAEVAAETVAG